MPLSINIICLDVPFPANYGGAINMFHKIRWLKKLGVDVYLHSFMYGSRRETSELNKYCKEVYYYKRNTNISAFFSFLPYNITSRVSNELKTNLLKNDFPILFEALHSSYLYTDSEFDQRIKIHRESNIEHDYFFHLAKNEKNFLKRLYFFVEAYKLKWFERHLAKSDLILSVSTEDEQYFKKTFSNVTTKYLSSFHQFDVGEFNLNPLEYILYHGNLSVSENYMAVDWLIDNVFSIINYKVIIAGLNAPAFLKTKILKYDHISLIENCSEEQMHKLIYEAKIHCLYTAQATGLKLQLLNVLFSGGFVIANSNMVHGTDLYMACNIANSPSQYLDHINKLMHLVFNENEDRKSVV